MHMCWHFDSLAIFELHRLTIDTRQQVLHCETPQVSTSYEFHTIPVDVVCFGFVWFFVVDSALILM